MADSLISPDGVLMGAGAWFAGKVFGPSAEALGQNLRAHLQARVPLIFGRAEEIAKAKDIELLPIRSGLLTRMIADASFSDDDGEITEWWANLFVSAASGKAEANIFAVFSDIMAVVGPNEAGVLKGLVSYYRAQIAGMSVAHRSGLRSASTQIQERVVSAIIDRFPLAEGDSDEVHRQLANPGIPLPVRTAFWVLPGRKEERAVLSMTTETWYSQSQIEIQILERARVLQFNRVPIQLVSNYSYYVELVGFTELGIAFYEACSGEQLEGAL